MPFHSIVNTISMLISSQHPVQQISADKNITYVRRNEEPFIRFCSVWLCKFTTLFRQFRIRLLRFTLGLVSRNFVFDT